MGVVQSTLEEKFLARFDLPEEVDGCWEWTGYRQEHGYGVIKVEARQNYGNHRAHRIALDVAGIRPPEAGDYVAHHVCGNRGCVNPDHLEFKTRVQHTRDHQGEFCSRGHAKTPENLYFYKGKPYHCKLCAKIRYQERTAEKRGL